MSGHPTTDRARKKAQSPSASAAATGPSVALPVRVRESLHQLSGSEAKVWLAYLAHADADQRRVAWPGTDLLARETGLHQDTISDARSGLVAKGWLEPAGFIKNSNGRFNGSKRFRILFPAVTDKTPVTGKHRDREKPVTEKIQHRSRGFTGTVTEETSARSSTIEEKLRKKRSRSGSSEPSRFAFSGVHVRISERQDQLLAEAFPWVDRLSEYRRMDSWLEANPERRPKKHSRFAQNWFSRIRENGKRPSAAAVAPAGKYSNLKSLAVV